MCMYQINYRRNLLSNGTQPLPVLPAHNARPIPVFRNRNGNTERLHARFERLQVRGELRGTAVDKVADWLGAKGDGVEDVGRDRAEGGVREDGEDRGRGEFPEVLVRREAPPYLGQNGPGCNPIV